MVFYNEWVDFVVYPGTPQKIKSLEDRLNSVNAMAINEVNVNYYFENKMDTGFIKTKNELLFEDGDVFECTYISDFGQVYIWTKFNVWTLLPEESDRLVFLRRHPYFSLKYMKDHGPFEYYQKWENFCILTAPIGPFLKPGERFEKQKSVKASRNAIKTITFSTYPLPENFSDFIDQFIEPNIPDKLLITEKEFIDKDDGLETMIFNCVSTPEIWTKNYACVLRSYERSERFIILPRNPDVICH